MAVDMTVRILNGETPGDKASGFPFRSGPVIQVITQETIDQYSYERLFGPRDFWCLNLLFFGGVSGSWRTSIQWDSLS